MTDQQRTLNPAQWELIREFLNDQSEERVKPGPRPREKDERAADLIRQFLDDRGWSPRRLAQEIELVAQKRGRPELHVSARTIDRIISQKEYGYVPLPRAKAAIALVMGVPPWRIWGRDSMSLEDQRRQMNPMQAAA